MGLTFALSAASAAAHCNTKKIPKVLPLMTMGTSSCVTPKVVACKCCRDVRVTARVMLQQWFRWCRQQQQQLQTVTGCNSCEKKKRALERMTVRGGDF